MLFSAVALFLSFNGAGAVRRHRSFPLSLYGKVEIVRQQRLLTSLVVAVSPA